MSTANYDEAVSLSYWLAKQLGEHVDVQADLSETLTDTVKRLIATMKPRVLEGDWESVRDVLDALPRGTAIRWESFDGPTVAIKRHGRWYEAGFSALRLSESIARDQTPIEVIA